MAEKRWWEKQAIDLIPTDAPPVLPSTTPTPTADKLDPAMVAATADKSVPIVDVKTGQGDQFAVKPDITLAPNTGDYVAKPSSMSKTNVAPSMPNIPVKQEGLALPPETKVANGVPDEDGEKKKKPYPMKIEGMDVSPWLGGVKDNKEAKTKPINFDFNPDIIRRILQLTQKGAYGYTGNESEADIDREMREKGDSAKLTAMAEAEAKTRADEYAQQEKSAAARRTFEAGESAKQRAFEKQMSQIEAMQKGGVGGMGMVQNSAGQTVPSFVIK
jgi:hypothetical protein